MPRHAFQSASLLLALAESAWKRLKPSRATWSKDLAVDHGLHGTWHQLIQMHGLVIGNQQELRLERMF